MVDATVTDPELNRFTRADELGLALLVPALLTAPEAAVPGRHTSWPAHARHTPQI